MKLLLTNTTNSGQFLWFLLNATERTSGGLITSGGKMKVRAIGAAALGSDTHIQQALIGGAQEIMVGSTAALVGITREMALWDAPFLISNAREADILLDGPIDEKIKDKLQDKGLVGLVYWENGFRNLTNSKRPVTKMEDLDGQENPYNTILFSKFYEVQKYLTVTNHVHSPWIVLVSKKWWDQLSKAEQKVLMDAAKTSREFERKDTREEASKAMADLKAKGMLVNELSPLEAERMRSKLTSVYTDIGKEVGMDM